MALSSTRLRDAIKAALDSRFGALTGAGDTARLGFASDLASAIVTEITSNAAAQIGTGLGALQREINNVGSTVDTLAPSATRSIPIV